MKTLLFCCLAISSAFSIASGAEENDAFAKANQEYAAGNFRDAIASYESLLKAGEFSAAVFYDLGNAHFRAGDSGKAILNYERALALEPHHPEAEANLRLVRDKARALELKRSPTERITLQGTATQYTVAAAIAFWIVLFSLAGIFFSRRRSPALVGALILSLFVAGCAGFGLYSVESGSEGRDLAIVVAKGTEARLATADSSGTVLALPPGSEVKILSTRGDWVYASLPNDLLGWIPAQSAERVRL
ncbi:MAG: tetratricopeptide repeat protein [Verrucomicrobiota bacterium]|nr:tetratricopeptide repeat protein [Verrucomicrobiota bacterium]